MNKKKIGGFFAALAAVAAGIVASRGGAKPPSTPEPIAMWTETCRAIWEQELHREIDPGGLAGCLDQSRHGGTAESIRATVRASAEYQDVQARPVVPDPPLVPAAPPPKALGIDGRFLIDSDGQTYRGLFASGLALVPHSPAERTAFYDQLAGLGLNGFRMFGGALSWAGQTPEMVRATLPTIVGEARARGLKIQLAALTDTGTGYDYRQHIRALGAIAAVNQDVIVFEVANEPYHATQADEIKDADRLTRLAREALPPGLMYALGAPPYDEPQKRDPTCTEDCQVYWPQPNPGGLITLHLDRGRDLFNRVRRVRELEAAGDTARAPVISGEPDSIADGPVPGKNRILASDGQGNPVGDAEQWAFTLGALCRGFEIAICVLHTESGLNGTPLGAHELHAARAYVEGWKAIGSAERLRFLNARWAGSPIVGATFWDAYRTSGDGVVRAYSFVTGDRGWTVLVGVTGDPRLQWGSGWHQVGVVAERPGVRVLAIAR